jgi:hypothetical protein
VFERKKKDKNPFEIPLIWKIAILLGFIGGFYLNPIPVSRLDWVFGVVGAGLVIMLKAAIDLLTFAIQDKMGNPIVETKEENLVTIAHFRDAAEAKRAKAKLESEGFEANFLDEDMYKSQLTYLWRLQVKRSVVEKAKQVLNIS